MDNATELLTYAELDGAEWGEAMERLCTLARYKYAYSPRFMFLLDAEIAKHLKYAKEHAQIITHVETTSHPVTILKWSM